MNRSAFLLKIDLTKSSREIQNELNMKFNYESSPKTKEKRIATKAQRNTKAY
jgi:hypothetical protein